MADSDALRSRRKRLHAQNDHSICKHRPRPGVMPVLIPVGRVPAAESRSSNGTGTTFDPAGELRALAARLVEAHAADPDNAALARELRQTLLVVHDPAGSGDPELDDLMASLAER